MRFAMIRDWVMMRLRKGLSLGARESALDGHSFWDIKHLDLHREQRAKVRERKLRDYWM